MDHGKPRRAVDSRCRVLRPAGRRGRGPGPRRPPVLHRLAGRPGPAAAHGRSDRRPALRAGRAARCGGQGADLALAPRRPGVQRGGEPRPQRDDLGRRRRGAAGPTGPARRLAPPEARGAAAPGRARAGRRLRRRDRPVPQPPRRRRAPRRPAAGADVPPVRAQSALARRAARGARSGGRRVGHPVPGTLDRPDAAGLGEPDGLPAGPAARLRPAPRPAARAAGRSAALRSAPDPGAAHLSRRASRATRSRRTASGPWPGATPRRSAGPAD